MSTEKKPHEIVISVNDVAGSFSQIRALSLSRRAKVVAATADVVQGEFGVILDCVLAIAAGGYDATQADLEAMEASFKADAALAGQPTEAPTMAPGELIAAITKLRREVWRHGWRASSGLRAAVEAELARATGALQ